MKEDATQVPRSKLPVGVWIAIAGAVIVFGIVVVGILATLVVPRVLQGFRIAQHQKAEVDLTAIEAALEEYSGRNGGSWPDSLEALVTPDVNGYTYLKGTSLPKDPWGDEYMYDPPESGRPIPRVHTYGRDGQPGGEGEDADIDNHSLRRGSRSDRSR